MAILKEKIFKKTEAIVSSDAEVIIPDQICFYLIRRYDGNNLQIGFEGITSEYCIEKAKRMYCGKNDSIELVATYSKDVKK